MEVVGTEGSVSIQDTHPNLMIVDKEGSRCPDTTYWPDRHGALRGALREELSYFADGIVSGRAPDDMTAEGSRQAVRACRASEEPPLTAWRRPMG